MLKPLSYEEILAHIESNLAGLSIKPSRSTIEIFAQLAAKISHQEADAYQWAFDNINIVTAEQKDIDARMARFRRSTFPDVDVDEPAQAAWDSESGNFQQSIDRMHRDKVENVEIVYIDYEMKFDTASLIKKHVKTCSHKQMVRKDLFTSHYYECIDCKEEVTYDEKRVVKNS